jgi:hypothetical protein
MRLWRFVALLALVQTFVAVAMTILPNAEGTAGGFAYAAMYVGPALLVSVAVQSSQRGWQLVAAWVSLVLSVFYVAVVVGNWSGYSTAQQAFAIGVNVPTVALYLAVFRAVVLRRREATPAGSG